MEILYRQLNPRACKTYLVGAKNSPEVIIIDPVLDYVPQYLKLFEKEKLKLVMTIDTHTHADHLSGGAVLKEKTGCDYLMHSQSPVQCVTERVNDGFMFRVGNAVVKALHTPGHSKDSLTLVFPEIVLTGDTLFLDEGGAGRDDLPGGNPGEHWESIQRILTLPEHLVVHPGHEYRGKTPSSLKDQKTKNPHAAPKTKEKYNRYVQSLLLGPADWMHGVINANMSCTKNPHAVWIPQDTSACEVQSGPLPKSSLNVSKITPHELKDRLDQKRSCLILDVREAEEFREPIGRMPTITHIPLADVLERLTDLTPHQDKEIITVCRTGRRAAIAAEMLMNAGFTKVQVLEGGMALWHQSGFPVIRE